MKVKPVFQQRAEGVGCLLLIMLCCIVPIASAQIVDKRIKYSPDTLSLADRLSLSTNAIDWVALLPNMAIEYDLRSEEWNRWALAMKVRGRWQTSHTYVPGIVYNMAEVKLEVRNYWRTRLVDPVVFPAHRRHDYLGKLLSQRRARQKHPNTTYYRGAYLSGMRYSLLLGKRGRQGMAVGAGFLYGIVKPLYQFSNGHSLDLDLGFCLGLCLYEGDRYKYDREDNCYPFLGHEGMQLLKMPMLSEARVAFVYRFGDGSHSLMHKYRYRFDVDGDYRDKIQQEADEQQMKREEEARQQKSLGNIRKEFEKLRKELYPKILHQNRNEEKKQRKEAVI